MTLEAASVVMLGAVSPQGAHLKKEVQGYSDYIASFMTDSVKSDNIRKALSTADVTRKGTVIPVSWEEAMFDSKPVVAAITLLTKLQSDVRYAEGEALATLLSNVDAGDVRVNELNAFVIPQSRNVMRGSKYSANIVLAAVDTTQRPLIFINGKQLDNDHGLFETVAGSTGTFDYKGYLEVPHGDGSVTRHDFESSYTVIEPTATISATMMNVLYAGIDNPMSISVPGSGAGSDIRHHDQRYAYPQRRLMDCASRQGRDRGCSDRLRQSRRSTADSSVHDLPCAQAARSYAVYCIYRLQGQSGALQRLQTVCQDAATCCARH